MNRAELVHTGKWWLSSDSDHLPGRLSHDKENKQIRLQIFGTSYMDGTPIEDDEKKRVVFYHEIINGDAHGLLTLHQCSCLGVQEIGKGLYQIDYLIGYVFFDQIVQQEGQLLISAGEFMYPAFKSFMDTDPVHGHKTIFTPEYDVKNRTEIVEISENLKIKFLDRKNEYPKSPIDQKEFRTVMFIYDKPVSFETLLEDGIYFKKLVEFSFGSHCTSHLSNVWTDERSPIRVWNTSLNKDERVSQQLRPSYHMLLSDDNFEGIGMVEAIRLWYKYRQVSTIFDLYIDSNYWFDKSEQKLSMVMFNNRFLNIVQALENFHRVAFSEQRPDTSSFEEKKAAVLQLFKGGEEQKELKQWLNNSLKMPKDLSLKARLDALLKWLKPETDKWFTNQSTINHFTWYASAMRNVLSHGKHRQTRPPKELRVFMITGQILLAACILKALKVKDVGEAVLHYQRFQDHLYEINRVEIRKAN